jgi:sulfonate transport system permease protein
VTIRGLAYLRARGISVLAILALAAAWEIAGHLSSKSPLRGTPYFPSFEFMFGPSLLGMADYWRFDMWAPMPIAGGERTYLGAFLALGYHSALTIFRLASGLVLGAVAGAVLGIAVSWSKILRKLFAAPLHMLRMFPLLAMIPLFQFWFGSNSLSAIAFVAYGVGVVYFVATINATSNVESKYIDYARTLGASQLRIYAKVIVPAIMPELFSSIMLTLGLAWSAVIGAEYIGVDSGIGRIIIWAQFFSATGRMMLVTMLLTLYAGISYLVCRRIAAHVLRWKPSAAKAEPIKEAVDVENSMESRSVLVSQ